MSVAHNEETSQSNKVADDWEDVGEEQVIAQIAERQKQLVAQKNEAEQLKLPEGDDDGQLPGPANPLGDRPVRLLRRPQSESKLAGSGDQSGDANRPMTFEERQAAYEQARERIFGVKSSAAESTEDPTSEDVSPSTDFSSSGPIVETIPPPVDRRNHLSDVPMKTTNVAPGRAWPPGPPPQQMWPVPMTMTAMPSPFGGYAPPPTTYGAPPPPQSYHLNDYSTAYPPMGGGPHVIPVTTAPPPMYHPAMVAGGYSMPPQPPQPPQPLCSVNPMITPISLTQGTPQRLGGYANVAARAPQQQVQKGQMGQSGRLQQPQQYSSGGRSPTQRSATNDGSRIQFRPQHIPMVSSPMQPLQQCNSTYGRPPQHLIAQAGPTQPSPNSSVGTNKF